MGDTENKVASVTCYLNSLLGTASIGFFTTNLSNVSGHKQLQMPLSQSVAFCQGIYLSADLSRLSVYVYDWTAYKFVFIVANNFPYDHSQAQWQANTYTTHSSFAFRLQLGA